MAQSDPPAAIAMPARNVLHHAERALGAISNRIAGIGVLGMLAAALVMVANIALRWLFNSGINALNEIVTMAFVLSISACLPAGLAGRSGVVLDFLSAVLRPRTAAFLKSAGSFLLFGFIALLAWRLYVYAGNLAVQNRTTVILALPLAPFFYGSAALVAFGGLVQAVLAIRDLGRCLAIPRSNPRVAIPDWIVLALAAVLIGLVAYGIHDLRALSDWAQSNLILVGFLSLIVMWVLLIAMVPLAVSLGATGIIGSILFIGVDPSLSTFGAEAARFLTDYHVATLPLFLLMGSFAAVAGISTDIYRVSQVLFGSFRGGLAMATIGGCAGFGAVTGSSLPTVAMFGRIALPEMRDRNYAPEFAIGCVAAGGTLGALIPPSSVLIIYALLTESSLGQLFAAAVVPAGLAVSLYIVTVAITVRLVPGYAPPPTTMPKGELASALLRSASFIVLFMTVLGGLYTGIFTATESAAVGAIGAFLIALLRRKLTLARLWQVMGETSQFTSMIYILIFGVLMFSFFLAITNLPAILTALVDGLPYPPIAIVLAIILFLLLLGTVMDSLSILLITTPIILPLIQGLGYDVIWWGIISLIVVEAGLITPPLGLHLFMLGSMARDVRLSRIYVGILPFVAAGMVKLLLVILIPGLALWLPSTMAP